MPKLIPCPVCGGIRSTLWRGESDDVKLPDYVVVCTICGKSVHLTCTEGQVEAEGGVGDVGDDGCIGLHDLSYGN